MTLGAWVLGDLALGDLEGIYSPNLSPTTDLVISTTVPNVLLFNNFPPTYHPGTVFTSSQDRSPIVAVVISLFNDDTDDEIDLLLWSGSYGGVTLRGVVSQFSPRLVIPFEIGMNITTVEYGEPSRGVNKTGNIEFVLDEEMWSYLGYNWNGRDFIIFEGVSGDVFGNLIDTYLGQVFNLSFDTSTQKINVQTTDGSVKFDKPLVEDFFPDDALESLRGRPYPWIRGWCYSVEPVLEDEINFVYRLSFGTAITILEVRVGGIVWTEDSNPPSPTMWAYGTVGTFVLGSPTLGEDVRVDVKAGTYSSMELLREVILHFDGEVDETGVEAFESATPHPVGFYTKEQINILDFIDQVVVGAGGYWEFTANRKFKVQLLEMPNESLVGRHSPMINLDQTNVISLSLEKILPAVKRITTEYKRNWNPMESHILGGVTDEEKARQQSSGIQHIGYENLAIDDTEAHVVEVPVIRTLYVDILPAVFLGLHLGLIWDIEKRIYEVTCWLDQIPELYDTVYVDYQMVVGYFRIYGIIRQVGSGIVTLRLWGNKNTRITPP